MFAGHRINDINKFLKHYQLNKSKWGVKKAMDKNSVTLGDFYKLPAIYVGTEDLLKTKVFLLDIPLIQKFKFLAAIRKEIIKGNEHRIINDLKSNMEELADENKQLQSTLHRILNETKELRISNDRNQRQNGELIEKMNEMEIKNGKLHEFATKLLRRPKAQMASLKNENQQLKISNHGYHLQMESLKNENQQLKISNHGYYSQIVSLKNKNEELKISNYEYDVQNGRLMDECKELQLRLNETKQRLKEMEIRMNTTRYREWTSNDLVAWICSLDNGRYEKYKNKLLIAFERQGVDGKGMCYLEKQDLEGFGVDAFIDRSIIYRHIQSLVNNNKINNNQHRHISEANEGQNETNYMQ